MPDVLLRELPTRDLDEIRAAASAAGASVQSYLRDTVHAQAVHLRRQAAIAVAGRRLQGRPAVSDAERQAVLDTVDRADEARAAHLGGRLGE